MDKHQRCFHREAFTSMGNNIRNKINSVVAKVNQDYRMSIPFFEDVTNADIGRMARFVVYKVDELRGMKSVDSDSNTFRGMEFLEEIAAGLKEDREPDSLYHKVKTARRREQAKEVVSFYLALNQLAHEGVRIPEGLGYTEDQKMLDILGAKITEDKGLTLDDVPRLKDALADEPKEVRDASIGLEHFFDVKAQQKDRISDKDVEGIDYATASFNVGDVVRNMKSREDWEDFKTVVYRIKGMEGH